MLLDVEQRQFYCFVAESWGKMCSPTHRECRDVMQSRKQKYRVIDADELVKALEMAYAPQNPLSMHPADFVTKRYKLDGHESLEFR